MSSESPSQDPIIELLQAIDNSGSINQASKSLGLSYKATWERIDTINNLSPTQLISRQAGGSGGGGTVLTPEGHQYLARVLLFRQHLQKLVSFFQQAPEEAFSMLKALKEMEMKISARNIWLGRVTHIEHGAVNSTVTISLKGEDIIVAVITENSVQRLRLNINSQVLAIVKAPSVILSDTTGAEKISARNILNGTINRIINGSVNDEVVIDLSGGNTVTSILTSKSVKNMGLHASMDVSAIIKASSVILAIP